MYLTHLKTLLVETFTALLDPEKNPGHPVLAGKDVWVGPEFPALEANYPGVWVTYDPGVMRRAGIGHAEIIIDGDTEYRERSRWSFEGTVNLTVVALSTRERDELLDEVTRLFAFASEHPDLEGLRTHLSTNDLIFVNAVLEELRLGGLQAGAAPWGTEEMAFEGTVSFPVEGNFVSDTRSQNVLVPLSEIIVIPKETMPAPELPGGAWQ